MLFLCAGHGFGRTVPPAGYICHRCNQPGKKCVAVVLCAYLTVNARKVQQNCKMHLLTHLNIVSFVRTFYSALSDQWRSSIWCEERSTIKVWHRRSLQLDRCYDTVKVRRLLFLKWTYFRGSFSILAFDAKSLSYQYFFGFNLWSSFIKEVDPVPAELRCPLCQGIFKEAVMIPCCQYSFCDTCIHRSLLVSEYH